MFFRHKSRRCGAAAVELAVCLPLLLLVLVIVVDFARTYYTLQSLIQSARVAVAYESDRDLLDLSPYESGEEAGLAAAEHLGPGLQISIRKTNDSAGNAMVQAKASYSFRLLLGMNSLPTEFQLERSAYAQLYPSEDK